MRKIVENLYLGDRYSAPKDTQLRVSCAKEIFYEVCNTKEKDKFVDSAANVVYYRFEDYPEFEKMDVEVIVDAIKQIENNIATEKIYVHCLWGINRSASIVFMYMVRNKLISGDTYLESQKNFWKIYPEHSPNPGWRTFLEKKYPYNF